MNEQTLKRFFISLLLASLGCGDSMSNNAPDLTMIGAGMGCTPDPPDGGQEQMGTDVDSTGSPFACALLPCSEGDPNQEGLLGEPRKPMPPGKRRAEANMPCPAGTPRAGMPMFTGGCQVDDCTCGFHRYGKHKGGNFRHNVCANTQPVQNVYWDSNMDPPGGGSDAVLRGYCYDGFNYEPDGVTPVFREIKTSRFLYARISQAHVCSFIRRRVLGNVLSSIVKEFPAAQSCNFTYEMVFADGGLPDALMHIKSDGGVNILTIYDTFNSDPKADQKINISLKRLLLEDAKIAVADEPAAETAVMQFLGTGMFQTVTRCDQ